MAIPASYNPGDSIRRPAAELRPPINHSRRTWHSSGMQFMMETTSFSSPGMSFGVMERSGFAAPVQQHQHQSEARQHNVHPGNGLLGSALGLLDSLLSSRHSNGNLRHSIRRPPPPDHFVESDAEDSSYTSGDDYEVVVEHQPRRLSPRSVFTRFKDKIHEKAPWGLHSHEQSTAPTHPSRPDKRQSSYHTEVREPSWAQTRVREVQIEVEEDTESDEDRDRRPRPHPSRGLVMEASIVEALANTAKYHRAQARQYKKQLERAAGHPATSSHYLKKLVDDLETHEKSHANALNNMRLAEDKLERSRSTRPQPRRARQSQHRQSAWYPDEFPAQFKEAAFDPFLQQSRRPSRHPFDAMDDFDRLTQSIFGRTHAPQHPDGAAVEDALPHHPSRMPSHDQRKRPRYTATQNGPRTQSVHGFATVIPRLADPPPSLLRPEESKALFQSYTERWKSLSPSDSSIPYPARGLQASALETHETLWSPHTAAHPSTWSSETIMQANAQAFFLGVVGLAPQYQETQPSGRIECRFDRRMASAAQVEDLVDLMKKEKTRWHSDRLGRRNDGQAGMNEELQRDDRARAVFHGVCELMDFAQQH